MGLLSALTGIVIETIKLPIAVAKDVIDLDDPLEPIGHNTKENLERIKEEAEKADD